MVLRGRECFILALVTNYGWEMNFKLEGYNECLITCNGAASPTHPFNALPLIRAGSGQQIMGSQYGIPVIFNYNGLQEMWVFVLGTIFLLRFGSFAFNRSICDYWALTQNHSKIINQCIANPKQWKGHSDKCWGLTASYSRNSGSTGYSAHQPNNDLG
jgi:hypothetical protein